MNNANIVAGRPNAGAIIGGPAPVGADGGGVKVYSCSSPEEEGGRYSRSLMLSLNPRKIGESLELREVITDWMISGLSLYELDTGGEFLSLFVPGFGLNADDLRNLLVNVVGDGPLRDVMANPTGKPVEVAPDNAPDIALKYSGYGLRTGYSWTILLTMVRTASDVELVHAGERVIAELAARGVKAAPGPATNIRLPRSRGDKVRFNGSRYVPIEPPNASAT